MGWLPRLLLLASGLSLDTEYADNVDFNDEEEDNLRAILPQATAILEKWNLFVNEDKTDFTHVYLANTGEADSDGNYCRVMKHGGKVSL